MLVKQWVLSAYRQNLTGGQRYLCQCLQAYPLQFSSIALQYNALLPGYRHQWNHSYPDLPPMDTVMTIPAPYAPLNHKQMYPHEGGIYPILPLQSLQTFYTTGLKTRPIHAFQTIPCDEPVSVHLLHQEVPWKQSPTSNNRCRPTSSGFQYLL